MTAYHYWQNQPGCSPIDIYTLLEPLLKELTTQNTCHATHKTFTKP